MIDNYFFSFAMITWKQPEKVTLHYDTVVLNQNESWNNSILGNRCYEHGIIRFRNIFIKRLSHCALLSHKQLLQYQGRWRSCFSDLFISSQSLSDSEFI